MISEISREKQQQIKSTPSLINSPPPKVIVKPDVPMKIKAQPNNNAKAAYL